MERNVTEPPIESRDPADLRGYEPIHPGGGFRRLVKRALAPLALLGGLAVKFKAVALAVLKLKFLATSLTMLVSVAGYSVLWGWRFAAGFVLLLLVHELGHVFEAKRQGIPISGVFFIPFLGAVMAAREGSKNAAKAAWLGLAGPLLGSAAALATWGAGIWLDSDFLVALAFTGFFLNLINLLPVMPLDGGWATAVFHPVFWVFGLAGLVVLQLYFPTPIILIVIALGAWELWKRWKRRDEPESVAYYAVTGGQRAAIAGVYLTLAAMLALGMSATHEERGIDGELATAAPASLAASADHTVRYPQPG